MTWEYKRQEPDFKPIPAGRHRIRIKSVEKAVSKNGNDMLAFQFEVSGSNQILYHYIVFLDDRPEITNRMLTQFFDSFKDIPEGDFDLGKWVGKAGAAVVENEEDGNGGTRSKIKFFIRAKSQDDLPPWVDYSTGIPASDSPDLPF